MNNNDELDTDFYFDLEQMEKSVNSPGVEVPEWALTDAKLFRKWLTEEFTDDQR